MDKAEVNDIDATSERNKNDAKNTPLGNFGSIENFTKNGLLEIMDATKAVNAFPQGSTRDLYCAYPTFGKVVDEQSDRILGIISKVLKWQNIKGNIQRRQPDEQFEMLLECNDIMLERLNSNLDEMSNIKKPASTILVESRINTTPRQSSGSGSWNLKPSGKSTNVRLLTAKNIVRPQIKFTVPVDNNSTTPFIPKIKDKPNSLKPLAVLPEYDDSGNISSFLHPYECELDKFEIATNHLTRKTPSKPLGIDSVPYMNVDTVEKLHNALQEIKQESEIAVDVEHHSYRSFLGFTCLVQISTRNKDYLFDALELREQMHVLNEVFTNPKVVKIFHGADSDIEWLQRDLSIYVVNMFDTHQAAKALNFARLSLAYLLKHYCNIEADKTFQLADWRIRPLPEELIAYARQDTRFLIYIYECINNDLLEISNDQSNLLRTVFQRSTELCKKRYVKPVIRADSFMELYRKSKRIFDNRQLFALSEIFQWRDTVARQDDESYGYVLPNHMMLHISESLPREMQGILACCNPIPPLVRQHLHALHQIILRSREQPLVKPILENESIHRMSEQNVKDYNSKLYCPHDHTQNEEFRDDLPTLLIIRNGEILRQPQTVAETKIFSKPTLGFFSKRASLPDITHIKQSQMFGRIPAITPYQRYLAVLPIAEKEKREEAERLEAERKKRKLCPSEPTHSTNTTKAIESNPDEPKPTHNRHKMPIREMLKRKPTVGKPEAWPQPKRLKSEMKDSVTTPNDNKLNFVHSSLPTKSADKPETSPLVNVVDQMPSTSKSAANSNFVTKKKFKAKQRINQNLSSDKTVAVPQGDFEYTKVDFKKFRGGGQRAKGPEIRTQFHPKNNPKKANNKKFNKLFTFSNVKGKK